MSSKDIVLAAAGGSAEEPLYVEDVFSTYLYTGNGTYIPKTGVNTIVNGIDLAGEGGLVWAKIRSATGNNVLFDTARGVSNTLISDTTDQSLTYSGYGVTSFNSNGFTLQGNLYGENTNGAADCSWTFRKAPKFFDVVTYTGNGVAGRQISHSLGQAPGMIIVKNTSASQAWCVWQRAINSGTGNGYLFLNTTVDASLDGSFLWGSGSTYIAPTSTEFTVNNGGNYVNANGSTYVAYLFAHDTDTDGLIQCGSYTGNGSTSGPTVSLGWEPQYVMVKASSATGNWVVEDNIRNMSLTSSAELFPNLSNAETNTTRTIVPNATGFSLATSDAALNGSGVTYIYMAIRRGPMKTPTDPTTVFKPVASSANTGTITSGFPTDMVLSIDRTTGTTPYTRMEQDRLRGGLQILDTLANSAEFSNSTTATFASNTGIVLNGGGVYVNGFVHEQFRRAPGFFDVVCYTGNGVTGRTVNHNLGVAPELMIVKSRSNSFPWLVYSSQIGFSNVLYLNFNYASSGSSPWYATPTSSVFSLTNSTFVNGSNYTYAAYLFASCPGVSKVGGYSGTGSTQTISCGFTGGARFVLIKRTDSSGDWYVWDTARGMTAGTDPSSRLNVNNQEVNANWVYTTTGGFQIVTTDASVNASGGSYIYLAVA